MGPQSVWGGCDVSGGDPPQYSTKADKKDRALLAHSSCWRPCLDTDEADMTCLLCDTADMSYTRFLSNSSRFVAADSERIMQEMMEGN